LHRRNHHYHQSVDVKYVVARGTLDDAQWQLLQRKINVVGQCVAGTNTGDLDIDMDMDEEDAAAAAAAEAEALAIEGQPSLKAFMESNGVHDNIAVVPPASASLPSSSSRAPSAAAAASSFQPSSFAGALPEGSAATATEASGATFTTAGSSSCAICGASLASSDLAAHVVECAEQFAEDAFADDD
jgi:hypothetical protein